MRPFDPVNAADGGEPAPESGPDRAAFTIASESSGSVSDPREADRQRLKAAVKARLFGDPEPTRIGRFTVLRPIGQGGMGVVYSAYDDELERKVAIKLLRPGRVEDGGDAPARLLREAQAMARLSHPNVIPVFEVGTHDGDVYVAMEYVRGKTLREWLAERRRSVREIVDAFRQAGTGLAAAHAAGLVHRDFKPDNVLVGDDGRVRVVDFGLARPDRPPPPDDALPEVTIEGEPTGAEVNLTRDGAILGTPPYMAPEQHAGLPVEPRTDQFSFCVALYEALYGERPFAGDSQKELAFSVMRGKRRPEPAGAKIPAWIREVVLRGLEVDPEKRHRSMNELLVALGADPASRMRTVAWAAAGCVAVAGSLGVGAWLAGDRGSSAATCAAVESKLVGLWDSSRRTDVQAALEQALLEKRWKIARSEIDGWVGRWQRTYVAACEPSTDVDEAGRARIHACLDWRLRELGTAVAVVADPTMELPNSVSALGQMLDDPVLCGDPDNVDGQVPPPTDDRQLAEVARLRARLASVWAYRRGDLDGAAVLARAKELVQEAKRIGHGPAQADALLALSGLQHHLGHNDESVAAGEEAAFTAEAAGDDRRFAFAAGALAKYLAIGQNRIQEADGWLRRARAVQRRLGPDPKLAHRIAELEGTMLMLRKKNREAVPFFEEALSIAESIHGKDSPELLVLLNNFSLALREVEQLDRAEAMLRRHENIVTRHFGSDSVHLAFSLMNLSSLASDRGRLDEAVELGARAVRIVEAGMPDGHPWRALALSVEGNALERLDRIDDAMKRYRQAVRVAESGSFDHQAAQAFTSLVRVLHDRGLHGEALVVARRLAEMLERQFSGRDLAQDRSYADLLGYMAIESIELGNVAEADAMAANALERLEQQGTGASEQSLPRYVLLRVRAARGADRSALAQEAGRVLAAMELPHFPSPVDLRLYGAARRWLAAQLPSAGEGPMAPWMSSPGTLPDG